MRALGGLTESPGSALEVLRRALWSKDSFVVEESMGALRLLGREAEPMLDEVLTLMADGQMAGVAMHVVSGALPTIAACFLSWA